MIAHGGISPDWSGVGYQRLTRRCAGSRATWQRLATCVNWMTVLTCHRLTEIIIVNTFRHVYYSYIAIIIRLLQFVALVYLQSTIVFL